MKPSVGTRLSHYRLVEQLGSGGMGVVFRAVDERLERDVALKVVAGGLLADEHSRRRFSREVLAISQLSHPNIALVYDFDTQGDLVFLAMELLRGETLAEALKRGPLSLREALDVGMQLALALESAHENGVLHRDLKPGNIMLLPTGTVKVVDFGLAGHPSHEIPSSPGAPGDSSLPTTTKVGLTAPGQTMGTPGYMSPEQLLGQRQDHRTDVFSFGCVLFECFSGCHAFSGATVDEIINANLAREPSWSTFPASLPSSIRDLVRRCLEKDPRKRPSGMGEIRLALEEISGDGSSSRNRFAERTRTPHNLPENRTRFVGRDKDLAECARLLTSTRLVTLVGPGGCGKTRLAIRVAETLQSEFPDGVWFLDLALLADGSRVEGSLASILGLRTKDDDLRQSIQARLRDERVLIVLDNCEHLLSAAAGLAQYVLSGCPHVCCLATSREALAIPEERSYVVPPLSVPRASGDQSADSIAPYESVRLFLDRASAVLPGFRLSDDNAPLIAEVSRRLEGIPLAIEIAAARAETLSLEEICSGFYERFPLLLKEGTSQLSRHQTLWATIQWSENLLLEVEREFLRALSVFAGGWTLQDVARVLGEAGHELHVLDLLNRLVGKSLVAVDRLSNGGVRYRLLESIRQYALEHLGGTDREIQLRDRHRDAFVVLADEAGRGLVGSDQADWLARLELEHENLLAAIEWSARPGGNVEAGLRIAGPIWRFWYGHGHFAAGRDALRRILSVQAPNSQTAPRGLALRAAGVLAYYQGDFTGARRDLGESLRIYRSLGDKQNVARCLNALGGVAMDEGSYDEARPLLEESLALSREIGDPGGLGVSYGNLGILASYQGDKEAADAAHLGVIAAFREAGDLGNVAMALSGAAGALGVERVEEVRSELTEALTLVRDLGEKRIAAYVLDGVADLVASLNDAECASRLLGASYGLRQQIGAPLVGIEQSRRQTAIDEVRARQAGESFDNEWSAGTKMSFETAVEYGLWRLSNIPAGTTAKTADGSATSEVDAKSSTAALLSHAQSGDGRAQNQLARRFLPTLTRWAHGRLPAAARGMIDTDDLVQVTLGRAFARLNQFEMSREGALVAYLRKILLNEIRDAIRRSGRQPTQSTDGDPIDQAPSPLEETVARNTFECYEGALSRLPEIQREAIILRLEFGYSFQEIADAVGARSANTARMSVTRGIKRVTETMQGRGR